MNFLKQFDIVLKSSAETLPGSGSVTGQSSLFTINNLFPVRLRQGNGGGGQGLGPALHMSWCSAWHDKAPSQCPCSH